MYKSLPYTTVYDKQIELHAAQVQAQIVAIRLNMGNEMGIIPMVSREVPTGKNGKVKVNRTIPKNKVELIVAHAQQMSRCSCTVPVDVITTDIAQVIARVTD